MSDKGLAVVGERDSVLAFKALGMVVAAVETGQEAARAVQHFAREGFAVVFITESMAALIPELLSRYRHEPLPAIIPIPTHQGATGMGMAGIKQNIEKAVGADILYGKDG
nr:V-type ATP synthase subunit F [bacterium]